ncbi:MAG: hypothetical protein U0168_16175 [Nannocystaceae bacterium]
MEYEVQEFDREPMCCCSDRCRPPRRRAAATIVRISPILPTGYDAQDTQIWIAETISPISSSAEQPGLTEVKAKPT